MSIYILFLVGFGGCLGSVFRYLLSTVLISFSPWVTVVINVAGGFLIGFVYRYVEDSSSSEQMRAFWVIGVCGGFYYFFSIWTRFFSFSQERPNLTWHALYLHKCCLYNTCSVFRHSLLSVSKLIYCYYMTSCVN